LLALNKENTLHGKENEHEKTGWEKGPDGHREEQVPR
jgi:hypothetical protein